MAQHRKATTATQWKSKTGVGDTTFLDVPSGVTVRVRRIKPEAFLEGGMIPDALSDMVQTAIKSKKGLPPKAVEELAKDPEKISAALEVFDRALVFCVVDPPVEMALGCDRKSSDEDEDTCDLAYTARIHIDRKAPGFHHYIEPETDPEVMYADNVSLEDKQFIFQWAVGGVQDIAKFRRQLAGAVESAQPGEGVPPAAE